MTTTEQLTKDFFAAYLERAYAKGELLLRPGDSGIVYYIESGVVVQYDISERGEKLVVNTYKPGSFLYLPNLLGQSDINFFFEASEQVVARRAPSRDVATFIAQQPGVAYDTLVRLTRGTDGLLRRMAGTMAGGAEARVLQELKLLQARFPSAEGKVAITIVELAAQTGLARETVSRAVKKLRETGAVNVAGGKFTIF
jgi:CRP/FNR family transcriptional regulator